MSRQKRLTPRNDRSHFMTDSQQKNRRNLIIPLLVWGAVVTLIRALGLLRSVSWLYDNTTVITAMLLLYVPVMASIVRRTPITFWPVARKQLLLDVKWFLITTAVVFPAAFFVNHFYQELRGLRFSLPEAVSVTMWGTVVLNQLLLVAFPEEFFFRGYLQEVFEKVFPAKRLYFGARLGCGSVVVSLLFAVSHSLIFWQWWHAFIFFPAMVFAWLKQKTNTIWAPTLFHATCNVFAYWVALHYR